MQVVKNDLDFKDKDKYFVINKLENYKNVVIVAEIKFLLDKEEKESILGSIFPYTDILCYLGMKNKEYYYLFFFKSCYDSDFVFEKISFKNFSTEVIYLNPYFKNKYDKYKELKRYQKYLIQKNITIF